MSSSYRLAALYWNVQLLDTLSAVRADLGLCADVAALRPFPAVADCTSRFAALIVAMRGVGERLIALAALTDARKVEVRFAHLTPLYRDVARFTAAHSAAVPPDNAALPNHLTRALALLDAVAQAASFARAELSSLSCQNALLRVLEAACVVASALRRLLRPAADKRADHALQFTTLRA